MSKVVELFGRSSVNPDQNWFDIVQQQQCPFLGKRCYKVRKSNSEISIGTCTVLYGRAAEPVIICPTRLIDRRQIFLDCLHLLTPHEPGNELHIVSEVSIPGGSVDYFLVSARNGQIRDFVGIELQTLDTTGTVWPERQRLLAELGVPRGDDSEESSKTYGMNWKMTAKTILVQMHHKFLQPLNTYIRSSYLLRKTSLSTTWLRNLASVISRIRLLSETPCIFMPTAWFNRTTDPSGLRSSHA